MKIKVDKLNSGDSDNSNSNNSYSYNYNNITITDHIRYICRTILMAGLPLTIVSGLILFHSSIHSSATFSGASSDNLVLSIPSSCTLSSVVNSAHNATLISGTYTTDIGRTTITTLCNDGNGYAIYANGLTNGIEGNNVLASNISNGHNIGTGIYTQGTSDPNTSSWAMKLNSVTVDSDNNPLTTPPTIETSYNNAYTLVPSTWTRVAGRSSGTTDMITGSSFTTTYAVYTAPTQHAGTYIGQVAYALIHAYGDDPAPIYIMQDVANWKDSLTEEESIQAVDIRDGKTYWVTKLKDGNVWMTQNLDFNIDANTTLNSQTTDLNECSTVGYINGYSKVRNIIYWTPASTATTINFEGTTVTGWQSSNSTPYSANKIDDTSTGHNSLGNYYNWSAAVASNDSSALTTSTYNDISKNPQNSICPKGWRLPTISNQTADVAGSTNEFARLNYLYNNNRTNTDINLLTEPLYFAYSGRINDSLTELGVRGYGISSTIASSSLNYNLNFGKNLVVLADGQWSNKNSGFSVRCVAR